MKEQKQVAALPVRRRADGSLEALLITSRETQRWVIAKGWPMKGRTDAEAAAKEAEEEAGVIGKIGNKPIGRYTYFKRRETAFETVEVAVYLLVVKRELETWREKEVRTKRWLPADVAAQLVVEPGLAALIARAEDFL